MDELVKQVSERTGLSADLSRQAVETVITYLKGQLPAPIASQIDAVLGSGTSGDTISQAMAGLGGLFGDKK